MDIRQSPATSVNPRIVKVVSRRPPANASWLSSHVRPGAVVLIGGAALVDFRVRVAQSHFRSDMCPSFWSMVGLADSPRTMLTVPLSTGADASTIPSSNAVQRIPLAQFDNAQRYPNVSVLYFAEPGDAIIANLAKLRSQRAAIDLPSLLLPWLAFVWGARGQHNPLLENIGLPGAVLVQTAFGMSGVELTPGLTSSSSCPEAIWQSAMWWHGYYEKTADVSGRRVATDRQPSKASPTQVTKLVPAGRCVIRQEAAAVTFE